MAGWSDELRTSYADDYAAYLKDAPELADIPIISRHTPDTFSVEKALALKPDLVVLTPRFAGGTSKAQVEDTPIMKRFAAAGVPVIVVDFFIRPMEHTVPSLRALGSALGEDARTEDFITFYEQHMQTVRERLADLPARLHEFDAIISSTASTLPIIGLGAIRSALKKRRHRPIFMVDLAVPRDIEPEVAQLNDAYLYTVDDLSNIVQKGHASREAAVEQAEAIVDAGVQSFMQWLAQRDPDHGVVPLIRQLNSQADQWQALELARARRRLARGEDVDAVLQSLARGMSQKMLHGAMAELHTSDVQTREQTMRTVQRLFLRDGTTPR